MIVIVQAVETRDMVDIVMKDAEEVAEITMRTT
jgi:hypothetical protein